MRFATRGAPGKALRDWFAGYDLRAIVQSPMLPSTARFGNSKGAKAGAPWTIFSNKLGPVARQQWPDVNVFVLVRMGDARH
jgi:hypothetical protein